MRENCEMRVWRIFDRKFKITKSIFEYSIWRYFCGKFIDVQNNKIVKIQFDEFFILKWIEFDQKFRLNVNKLSWIFYPLTTFALLWTRIRSGVPDEGAKIATKGPLGPLETSLREQIFSPFLTNNPGLTYTPWTVNSPSFVTLIISVVIFFNSKLQMI